MSGVTPAHDDCTQSIVGIRGSSQIMPRNGTLVNPGRVEVHIGDPIAPEEVAKGELRDLIARTRDTVADLSAMPVLEDDQG